MWMPFDGLPYGAANVNLAHTDSSPQDLSWEKSAWLQAFEHQAAHMCFYSSSSVCLPVFLCLSFIKAKLVVKQSKNGSGCTLHTLTQHEVDFFLFFFYKGPALFKKLKLRRCPTIFHQNLSYDFLVDASLIDLRFLGYASHYHWEKYTVKWWSGHLLLSLKSGAAAVDVG